ncbi:carboxypeptidase [Paenibacillaceae bacterium]|nr:carboxypeptidase [Paenibacillaceae bacterium]
MQPANYTTKRPFIPLFIAALCFTLVFSLLPIPFSASASTAIVNPKQMYTYERMEKDLKALAARYPQLINLDSIGKSEYGRELWSLKLGKGPVVIFLNGSHHAREWITTNLLMGMADHYAQAYEKQATWGTFAVRDLLERVTFHIVPMVNPDGVTLQQRGLSAFPKADHAALLRMNGGSTNFKRWKANAKGIDLNRQYPADWATIRNVSSKPSYMNYKGTQPLQAKEAKALAAYAREIMPELAISYHSSGEILFWNFKTPAAHKARDLQLANQFASHTGYRLVTPSSNPSGGGFTDWFITEFGRPALTPELARAVGETNVPLSEWDRIWKQHRDTGWMLALEAIGYWIERQPTTASKSEVRLTADETAYQWPDLKSARSGKVYAGLYTTIREKGDWVELAVKGERKWIAARNLLRGKLEIPAGAVVVVHSETGIYTSPSAALPSKVRFAEQKLAVLEGWDGWYRVKTGKGSAWVKQAEVQYELPTVVEEPGEPEPSDQPAEPGQAEQPEQTDNSETSETDDNQATGTDAHEAAAQPSKKFSPAA